ncbi:aa3-type cytochrome c oxidase subunit IV [Sphingomonas sp. LaA6.9]|nr:aa3-type cytochrome c oxidase subunit IV [Sphingomonas sp. LaA6.9]MCJ8157166.1 aa3-type cytochrome c oxidase subunit IV [Sphingomonas sp. LaA6.9]
MADNGDMQMHDQTYHGFLTLLKVGTAASIILAAIVIFVIAN